MSPEPNGSREDLTPLFMDVERTVPLAKPDNMFQRLCHEAVLACGADLAAVEAYVARRLQHMDAAARESIRQDLHRVLAFRAPSRPGERLH